jgi:hypothetical protein
MPQASGGLSTFLIYTGLVNESEDGRLVRGNMDEANELRAEKPISAPIAESRPQTLEERPAAVLASNAQVPVTIHVHVDLNSLSEETALKFRKWLDIVAGDRTSVEIQTESLNESGTNHG